MNRRKFIRNSSLASAAVPALALLPGEAIATPPQIKENNHEPYFIDDFVLNEVTIDDLQNKMTKGETTSRAITEIYLKRIEAIDKNGPVINAVIEINPDAIAIANQMDEERKTGNLRGPLHGIPILIKDNIDSGDKMMTTAGSLALLGNRASKDAFVLSRLRKAGAVLLGKTNLSEWANFRSTRSASGWSSRGGQTKNPCMLNRNPSGSSSGSGAAVAANLCVVAVGTETDGSVIAPASSNGIVGIKPTVGLISRSGIIPISVTQDTAGPMARTVRDAAILLGAMVGVDETDKATLKSKGMVEKDYTKSLDPNALSGKRIGIEKSFLEGHEMVVAKYQEAIDLLRSKGAIIVEVELKKLTNDLGDAEYEVLQYEFKDGVNKYLASSNAAVKTLAEVISFNNKNEEKVMPYFQQEILVSSEAKGGLDSKEYLEALAKSTSAAKIIDDLVAENKLEAICGVSIGIPSCIDLVNGDYSTGFYFCSPAAMAGYPHITVPMGHILNLPVGLSFIAKAFEESKLFGLAYAYEQASKHRAAPAFKLSIMDPRA